MNLTPIDTGGGADVLQLPVKRAEPPTGDRMLQPVSFVGRCTHWNTTFEVDVELPPGTSPASVIGDLDELMSGMNPKKPHSDYAVGRAIHALSKPEPTIADFQAPNTDDDPFGDTPERKLAGALRAREEACQTITEQERWRKDREAALKRFDELGGTHRIGGGYSDDNEG